MKKILYVIIISVLLIGGELIAEYFVNKNQVIVSEWVIDKLLFLDKKKEI